MGQPSDAAMFNAAWVGVAHPSVPPLPQHPPQPGLERGALISPQEETPLGDSERENSLPRAAVVISLRVKGLDASGMQKQK